VPLSAPDYATVLLPHGATDQYRDHDRHVSDGFVIETTQNRVAKANSTEAS
jgi:hypothetical protein